MKLEKLQQGILSAVLSFCLSFGSISCMVTGLELNANLLLLSLIGFHLCAIFSIVLQLRWGGRFTLIGLTFVLSLVLFLDSTRIQLFSFVRDLTAIYATGFAFSVPELLEKVPQTSADLALLVVMGIVALCCSFTMLRRRSLFLAMTPALLTFFTCFIFNDTVPALWCILLWLFAAVMLCMTQLVRRRSGTHGLQLAKLMAIPVAIAVLGMSVLIPPSTTKIPVIPTDSIESVWNWVLSKFPYIGKTADGEPIFQIPPEQNDRVNLGALGPKNTYTTPVFEVTPQFSGSLYLRERDFDLYSGLDWAASEDRVETAPSLPLKYTRMDGEITIRTYSRRRYRFMPSYTKGEFTLTGGYLPNEDYANEYTLYRTNLIPNWQNVWRQNLRQDTPEVDRRYLELPAQTKVDAISILSGIELFSRLDDAQKASVIQRYVRESANYDLNADAMPEGREDFAIWFLEEAESGYCVHFATAATVLLRAAGIPARYVEGYQVDVRPNNTTVVRENAAHAWVEYYLEGIGWIVMDPTPPVDAPVLPPIDSSIDTVPPGPTVTTPRPTTQPPTTTVLPTGSAQPTTPSSNAVSPDREQPSGGADIWNVLLVIGAGILVLIGQWLLRRGIKKRRMYTGKPNTQALARYREATRLARWSKCALPEELTALAEKAAFSQHALTRRELAQFDAFFTDCVERMEKESFLRKLYLRLILAAY